MAGTPSGTKTNRTTGSLTLTYIGTNELTTSTATQDFGGFTAGSSGLMIASLYGRGDSTPSLDSISIGGSSGTLYSFRDSLTIKSAFACRQVSSGSNNVTANLGGVSGTNTAYRIYVWLLTGNTNDIPFSYDDLQGATSPHVFTATLVPQSVGIVHAFTSGSGDVTVTSFGTASAAAADDEISTTGRHTRTGSYANATDVAVALSESVTYSAATNTGLHYALWG